MVDTITLQALNFVPVMLSTLALILISFLVKKKKKLPWLIVAFIIWLITFLFAIGAFKR